MTRLPAAAAPAAALPATMNVRAHARASRSCSRCTTTTRTSRRPTRSRNQFMFGTELLVAPITVAGRPGHRLGAGQGLAAGGRVDRRVHRADATAAAARVLPAPRPRLDPGARPGRRDPAAGPGRRARRRHRSPSRRRAAGLRRRRRRVHPRRGPRRRALGPHPADVRRRDAASSPCTTSRATPRRCRRPSYEVMVVRPSTTSRPGCSRCSTARRWPSSSRPRCSTPSSAAPPGRAVLALQALDLSAGSSRRVSEVLLATT